MELTIFKVREHHEPEVYDTFEATEWYDYQEYDASTDFARVMWNKLIGDAFGDDYYYCADWFDYISTFSDLDKNYKGEGIYIDGKLVIGVDELKNGISEIILGNVKYYI